jgi:plastocyanin
MPGRSTPRRLLRALAVLGAACACGDTSVSGPIPPNSPAVFIITIQNFRFTPEHLAVTPGAAVLVRNMDDAAHSVTSAAAPGTYVFGGVNGVEFDTGPFHKGDRTFTVPATAPVGTVVPYFCIVSRNAMLDAADVTIVAPAQP